MRTRLQSRLIWIVAATAVWTTAVPQAASAKWKADWEQLRSRPYPK